MAVDILRGKTYGMDQYESHDIESNHRLNCDSRKSLLDAEFDESLVLNRVTFILVLLSMSESHFLKADIISPNSKVSSAEG